MLNYKVCARLKLNGKRTVEYTDMDPGIEAAGFIALQSHSGRIIEARFNDTVIQRP